MLRNEIDRKMMLQQPYVRELPRLLHQHPLNLKPRRILMVQNPPLRVCPLHPQLILPALLTVELHPHHYHLLHQLRALRYHHLHNLPVAQTIPRHQRILDMLLIRIVV